MDYDDNDFQSQNLHLAGEGSNKYPQALQPYALPKFDFDDSLNGHLRFDSLVETEVFLGIEGNEDSTWIEDFSRGSSGVVFSSSAAESCAISRHNNVWSEATSSESVEMLLKSVGQDEVIARENTVKKSEACDELGCIMKQMEPSQTRSEKSLSKEETVNLLSVDEKPGQPSALNADAGLEQPMVREASPTVARESTVQDKSTIPAPKTVVGEAVITEKLQNDSGDTEQDFVDQNKIGTEMTECLDKKEPEVSSELRMEIDRMDGNVQNVMTGSSELNNQKTLPLKNNINDKNDTDDSLLSNYKSDDLSGGGKSVPVDTRFDSHIGLASEVENVEEENAGDTVKPDLKPAEPSDFPVAERCSQGPAIPEASGQDVSVSCNDSEAECQNFLVSGAHGGSTAETCLDPTEKLASGQSSLGEEEAELQSHQHVEIAASEHEASISAQLHRQTDLVGTSEAVCVKPVHSMDELTKTCADGISGVSDTNEGNDHAAAGLKQRTDLAFDSRDIDRDTGSSRIMDERMVSESFGYVSGGSASGLAESKSQSDSIPSGESGRITDRQQCQALPLTGEELKQLGKEEAPVACISSSADLSVLKTSSNANEQGPVSESEKVSSCETGDDQALPVVVSGCRSGSQTDQGAGKPDEDTQASTHNQTDQGAGKPDEDTQASTHTIEGCPSTDGSKEAEAEDAGRSILQKSEETILEGITEFPQISETEPVLAKDSVNAQCHVGSLDNPGNRVGKDGQKDDNTTASADNMKAIPTLCTKGTVIKTGDSSCTPTFPETSAKSDVAGREKAVADPQNPSASFSIMSKSADLPRCESETNSVKKLEDRNTPSFMNVDSQSQGVKRNDASSGNMSLTSDVTPLADSSMKKVGKNSEAVNSLQATLVSPVVVGSPSTSSLEKTVAKTSKVTSGRKPRRTSKAGGKETYRKGSATKETTPSTQLPSGGKTSVVNQSSPCTGQITQSADKQQTPHTEAARLKPFGTFSTSVSSLPDLNSSALSTLFQRPFADLQQVQLRAQIFVYGALIQGTAPDEAYMISAFGGPDGGKGIWEKAWRACVERTQKSHVLTPETPLQSRTGARAADQITKAALPGRIATPSVGHASSKDIPAVNPIIPLSSPLWSLPTPRDTLQSSCVQRGSATDHQPVLSSLHAHQTQPIKNIIGHNTPWISPSPYRSPWLTSPPTNAFDVGARFPVFPITEAVKLTPVKESSLPHAGPKHLQKDPIVQSGTSSSVVKGTPLVDPKSAVVAPAQHSTDTKPRKRKKMPILGEPGSSTLNSQKRTESVAATVVTDRVSTSVSITTTPANLVSNTTAPANLLSMTTAPDDLASKFSQEKFNTSFSSPILTGRLVSGNHETEQRSVLSEETVGKLKEAKVHAQDAAALAAAAVSHSQYVWKQIEQQKNAGLEPEIQGRLSSAAVAIGAAAAVAKAAAAAANVAANAALQAKLMAEEASTSNTCDRGNEFSISDTGKTFGQATPASILKVDGAVVSSSSVLIAAREAARKRVEAATAAAKRAENMDAIVKAAELAAEAVSQAGKLVTMGDPLPLNELVEAGPDNFWRHTQASHEVEPCKGVTAEKKDTLATSNATSASPRGMPSELDDSVRLADGVSGSVSAAGKKTKGQKVRKGADLTKSVAVVSEPEAVSKSSMDNQTQSERFIETSKENGIKEGSYVEVFKEGAGLRTAWYSANVLSLKDGQAYVCYTELSSEEGTDKLKEWVALEGESNAAPKIRTARPVTAMPFEGTRKRRRAATGDHAWTVGDRVDAWVHGSWCEGVITEKNKKDETTLTVHFPAQGETLMVKAWHLRRSLVWKGGRWSEYSSLGGNNGSPHEGDTPKEKRPRLGSPAGEVKGKDDSSKNVDIPESGRPPQTGLLDLAASDNTFKIGRSTADGSKPDPLRMKRTGLQKQGSRVIFGVPKPGKKRKFMEVSKHYVSEPGSKAGEQNEPAKFVKPTMPQSSGSRGWKNTSKSDQREKQTALSRPKVFKPASKPKEKPRAIPQKENSQNTAASNQEADTAADEKAENKGSVSGRPTEIQSGSKAGETTEEQTASSSHDIPLDKKTSLLGAKAERTNRGKLGPAAGRLAKIEEDKALSDNSSKSMSDVIEPRRSNRRIQPTSRLLEGLQTSMIISKIPSVSHGKGHPNQSKSSSRGK